jgi:hypothetical protein
MAAALTVAFLAGCGGGQTESEAPAQGAAPADAGYVAAPAVLAAHVTARGMRLEGAAEPGAKIRLATPEGAELFTKADAQGRWRLDAPPATQARLFSLSMTAGGRRLQSQGYVLLTDGGTAAVLRSGSGAIVLAPTEPPRLLAVDFDRQGAAVVSGAAGAQGAVSVRIDGRPGPVGRADSAGRFSLALPQPLTAGRHEIQILGDSFASSATIEASPAAPLAQPPFRATRSDLGLRADWMTPGGGLQSTWILN